MDKQLSQQQPEDRRHNTARRIKYAVRKAHDPMFAPLANPGTERMPKDHRQASSSEEHRPPRAS